MPIDRKSSGRKKRPATKANTGSMKKGMLMDEFFNNFAGSKRPIPRDQRLHRDPISGEVFTSKMAGGHRKKSYIEKLPVTPKKGERVKTKAPVGRKYGKKRRIT